MKRVVKSGASKDINAEDCKRGHVYIGENCHKEWFIVLPLPKGEYTLATPDEIADYIPIKSNTFASLVDLFDYFQGIQFYQFPDFRSAMEYYLEQSK